MGNQGPVRGLSPWSEAEPWPDDCDRLLIVGPPGTGKTTAVLRHYVWPALEDRQSVLATSFTVAAAAELRKRTAEHMDTSPDDYLHSLSTIHSEASRRVRHLGLRFGQKEEKPEEEPDSIVTDWEAALERSAAADSRDALDAWNMTRARYPQDIGLPVRQRLARILSGQSLDLAEMVVRRYCDGQCDDDGEIVAPDFTGLLELALTQGSPGTLGLLAIDEAQDLCALHWALVDRWAAGAERLLIVGDPDQAIYGWAGADGSRLLRWIRDGRPARYLAQSYRVPRKAHAMARSVIRQVQDREDAPYAPAPRDGQIVMCDGPDAIAEIGESAGSVLALARTKSGCSAIVDALIDADVPHMAERGTLLLRTRKGQPTNLLRAVRALEAITAGGRVQGPDLRRLVDALDAKGPGFTRPRVKTAAVTAIKGRTGRVDPSEIDGLAHGALADAWAAFDYEWMLRATLAASFDAGRAIIIGGWVREFGARLEEVAERVAVTTVHGSKGRQAGLVVLDARIGWRRAWSHRGSNAERDEDRRAMYVALTRTMDRLVIARGNDRNDWLTQQGIGHVG